MWRLIDAEGQILGRVATRAANLLRGKHQAFYSPRQEIGDNVIIINADKVRTSGNKLKDKLYWRHSGYPGGISSRTLAEMLVRKPTYPLEHAIRGMLPKNRLGRKLFKNLKVYAGNAHPHAGQNPQPETLPARGSDRTKQ